MTQFRIPEGVLFQELDRDSVLLHLGTEQYYALDLVGTRIWKLLAGHGSIDAAVRTLLSEFDTNEETLRGDIDALVRKLVAKGLLLEDVQADVRAAQDSAA